MYDQSDSCQRKYFSAAGKAPSFNEYRQRGGRMETRESCPLSYSIHVMNSRTVDIRS